MKLATKPSTLSVLGLLAISAAATIIQPTTASAAVIITVDATNTVTFNDATESLSLSISPGTGNNVDASVGCTGEICSVNLTPPSGYGGSGIDIGLPLYILEPGSFLISDTFDLTRNSSTGVYTVTFTSDSDPDGLGTFVPGVTSGTTLTETGLVQTAFTLSWVSTSDSSHVYEDIIQFQSDVDSSTVGVPEPMSLILFGAGLIGLGAMGRRRRANA